jgi:hypothetical protein
VEVALKLPKGIERGLGRRSLRFPVGGSAKGIPRKVSTALDVEPRTRPSLILADGAAVTVLMRNVARQSKFMMARKILKETEEQLRWVLNAVSVFLY